MSSSSTASKVGLEEVGLAREVVVERPAADSGLAQDLLGGGGGEALLGEEPSGRRDEPASGGLGAFCLRGHGGSLPASLQTDSWYVKCQHDPFHEDRQGGTDPCAPTVLPRRRISLSRGDVAYVDQGDGDRDTPAALFLHGVLVNADIWRNVMWEVGDMRRCIAPDLPAHGATPVRGDSAADLSLNGLADMLDELCERLGLEQVDLVANDTGGAVAQVFAAHYPERIRTLTLTNCDVHDNFPPEAFKPFVALAESGEFGPMVAAMAGDPALARSEVGFGMGYAHPEQLPDDILASYLEPFVADQGKGLERLLTASSAAELMAVAPLLAELHAPTLVAWGTGDSFFGAEWADRLASMIPGVRRVVLVPDAMLFWPDERAADLLACRSCETDVLPHGAEDHRPA